MGRFDGVELDDLQLVGARVTLRRWHPDDAPAVLEAVANPQMRRFLALPDPYTAQDARRFVTSIGHEGRADGTGLGCAVVETESGHLLGSAALWLPTPARPWPEIGYWIGVGARGHGYAAEATRLLAEWGFLHRVERIELRTDVDNIASARTALAAGFHYDGTRRLPDARRDVAQFSRLATDPGTSLPGAYPPLPAAGLTDGVVALRRTVARDAAAGTRRNRTS